MVAATGDWTKETLEVEYPAMRRLYALAGAERRVHAVRFQAEHNYNRDSREAVYGWMAQWLTDADAGTRVAERRFRPEALADLLVFAGRPLPEGALTREQLSESWIAAAQQQLMTAEPKVRQSALLHALGLEARRAAPKRSRPSNRVVVVGSDAALEAALRRAGFTVRRPPTTPFDAEAASKIAHFETYNRTEAGQGVADVVRAMAAEPHATLVATGASAILALAVAPVGRAIIDVEQFDNQSDAAFIDRLYIPGLRRAGDLQTAVSMASGSVVVHNAGHRFTLRGARLEPRKLTPDEVIRLIKQ